MQLKEASNFYGTILHVNFYTHSNQIILNYEQKKFIRGRICVSLVIAT